MELTIFIINITHLIKEKKDGEQEQKSMLDMISKHNNNNKIQCFFFSVWFTEKDEKRKGKKFKNMGHTYQV